VTPVMMGGVRGMRCTTTTSDLVARYREGTMSGEPLTPQRQLVHLRTVSSLFHARVIQARLGADGIPAQLRGNVGGPYPFGVVSIWVNAGDIDEAGDLLMADEVESAFDVDPFAGPLETAALRRRTPRRILAAFGLVLMAIAAFSTHAVW
jgi:hypothetical protein